MRRLLYKINKLKMLGIDLKVITRENLVELELQRVDDGVRKLTIPDGVHVLTSIRSTIGKNIEEVVLPNTLQCIEKQTFQDSHKLRIVQLPKSIEFIKDYAFLGCEQLEIVTGIEWLKKIGEEAFSEDVKLRANITLNEELERLCRAAFCGSGIKSIDFNNCKLKEIEDITFSRCSELKSVTRLPEYLIKIGNYAFSSCSKLESIMFPRKLVAIWDGAFYECKSLKVVDLRGLELTYVGENAFSNKYINTILVSNSFLGRIVDDAGIKFPGLYENLDKLVTG